MKKWKSNNSKSGLIGGHGITFQSQVNNFWQVTNNVYGLLRFTNSGRFVLKYEH